ncbi:MAG: glycosyltransferase [Phycisphaerales bacterium]|nr:glycosyltransferase [Planctomycetota bacterium]MBL6997905.1 glycosyltransferase [Phycisphaerales bacterium]
MKILHYCARLRLIDGGVVRAVLDLTSSLSQCGKTVTLMVTEGDDFPGADSGVQTMRTGDFDRPPIRFSTARLASLKQYIADADVLHLHTPWEPANIQLAKIARDVGTPYVISVHGMLDDWVMKTSTLKKRVFLRLGGRKMFHKAACVHCTARAEADQARRWIPKSNIVVVPLVFDPSLYLTPPPTSDPDKYWPQRESKKPIVLFLSRVHPKKGVDRLLQAAADVLKKSNVRFIIAGSGEPSYERLLQKLAVDLNIDSQIEFVGFVDGDRKVALLRAADLFVLPTSQENFGLVFPEAMACGLPVITTRGVDIWPELEESGGAIIISEDPKSIATAINQLLTNEDTCKNMGEAARTWVDSTFSGDSVTNQYIGLYRTAING